MLKKIPERKGLEYLGEGGGRVRVPGCGPDRDGASQSAPGGNRTEENKYEGMKKNEYEEMEEHEYEGMEEHIYDSGHGIKDREYEGMEQRDYEGWNFECVRRREKNGWFLHTSADTRETRRRANTSWERN